MSVSLPQFERCRVEIRLTRPASFPFEHGGVLRGLFARALRRHELPAGFLPFPCQSGHVHFAAGDPYALGVTLVGPACALAEELAAALERHGSVRREGPPAVLGGNFRVERVEWLAAPDLAAQVEALRGSDRIDLHFLSPLRLARPEERKRRGRGFLDRDCFPADYFLDRLWRRLFFLAHGRYPESHERTAQEPPLPEALTAQAQALVWSDLPVRGPQEKRRPYTLGGVRGRLRLEGASCRTLDEAWLEVLVAGSYLHAGSSTAYGCGRYCLTGTAETGDPFTRPARTLLEQVAEPSLLARALDHVLEDKDDDGPADPAEFVARLGRELRGNEYRTDPLQGLVLPKDDGGVRPLAVPVLRDKVAQRGAVEVLGPALDTLLEEASYAYRRGFSRQGAARAIERAYAEGFRYVLDADIRAFFDRVDWSILFAKLDALYPDEPLVEFLRHWIQAPVVFDGRRIERHRGLPQGSPISPLLANLYLDTFDEELLAAGFRLVRFADDFVVLTRDPESARSAKADAAQALARLRLELNPDETAIRSMDDGFSYLGYLFVRSLVVEERKGDEEASPEAPTVTADAVPEGSWLAAVPLERIEALLEGRRGEGGRNGGFERVPLARDAARDAGRWPLYVTTHDTRVFLRQGTLVLVPPGGEEQEVPLRALSHVVFVGRVRATVPVLRGLARDGVPSFFCRASGEIEAIFGPHEPDAALWLEQARAAGDEALCLSFSAAVVQARLRNLATLARRLGWEEAEEVAAEVRALARGVDNKTTLAALRGLEGRGTRRAFGALARSLPESWGFTGRARRPPPDPINAMLSFGYTLLHNHCTTALWEAGLHPRLGLFHQPRGAHAALASDLMEEFRHLVESLVWTLVRRRQLSPQDFRASPDGGYPSLLRAAPRQTFVHAFERRLVTEFTPDGEEQPLSYRAFLLRQARQIRALVKRTRPLYAPLVLHG